MTTEHQGRVEALLRYPIKGLSAEVLDTVELEEEQCFPGDRLYALENGPSSFDKDAPAHQSKSAFFMLMGQPSLAALHTRVDPLTGKLTIFRHGELLLSAPLNTPEGRRTIEAFFSATMAQEARGPVRLVHAPNINFTDMDTKLVHIINLASIRELDAALERHVDPARFRANIQIDGFRPWAEREWIGKKLIAGSVELEVVAETGRCAAINVDPATAKRNMTLPAELERLYGRSNFGVYAKVTRGGSISTGAPVDLAKE